MLSPERRQFASRGRFVVKLTLTLALLLLPTAMLTPACAAPLRSADPAGTLKTPEGEAKVHNQKAINQRFSSLDAYLAFLEKRSHLDGAWYREVRPGVYELQTGNLRLPDGPPKKRVFTREQLEKKFGFSR